MTLPPVYSVGVFEIIDRHSSRQPHHKHYLINVIAQRFVHGWYTRNGDSHLEEATTKVAGSTRFPPSPPQPALFHRIQSLLSHERNAQVIMERALQEKEWMSTYGLDNLLLSGEIIVLGGDAATLVRDELDVALGRYGFTDCYEMPFTPETSRHIRSLLSARENQDEQGVNSRGFGSLCAQLDSVISSREQGR